MTKDYKKLYEDALNRAKIKRDEYIRLDGPESHVPQDIEFIFPELAESKSESIRNNLIDYFSNCKALQFSEQEIVAWLEKQSEYNSVWSKEDDKIFNKLVKYLDVESTYYFNKNDYNEAQDWIKSIKERMQLQPMK